MNFYYKMVLELDTISFSNELLLQNGIRVKTHAVYKY